jgi:hypothetical protein
VIRRDDLYLYILFLGDLVSMALAFAWIVISLLINSLTASVSYAYC